MEWELLVRRKTGVSRANYSAFCVAFYANMTWYPTENYIVVIIEIIIFKQDNYGSVVIKNLCE